MYTFQGKYMEAIVDSDRALDLHSNYPKPLRRRAEMHEAVGMLDEAMKDYEKLVKIDPGHDSDKAACLVRVNLMVYLYAVRL